MAKRSSSSTAILALLSIDRWTPYELVQHMKRSTIHFIWPRAESKMYEELKRLAAAGYARATADRKDPRRTRYAITAAGRRVLSDWLAEPGNGVFFESEGALKVLFAENGTKEQLLATISSMRAQALATLEDRAQVFDDVARDGPPYPDRIHQSVLVFDLVNRLTSAVVEWADSAEARVDSWTSLAPDRAMRDDAMRRVADIRDHARTVVATHPSDVDRGSPEGPESSPPLGERRDALRRRPPPARMTAGWLLPRERGRFRRNRPLCPWGGRGARCRGRQAESTAPSMSARGLSPG